MLWWRALRVGRLHTRLAKLRQKTKDFDRDCAVAQGGLQNAIAVLGAHLGAVSSLKDRAQKAKDLL